MQTKQDKTMPLEIQIQQNIGGQKTGAVTVKLTGSLDTATAPELERRLSLVLAGPVKHEVFDGASQHERESPLQLGGGRSIETAGKFHGDGSGFLAADVLLDLNFEGHGFVLFGLHDCVSERSCFWPVGTPSRVVRRSTFSSPSRV